VAIKRTESQILTSICEYLALKKYFFWRSNNVPIYDSRKGCYRAMPKYARKGLPDIMVLHKSTFYGLEVKKDKGKLSEEQKEIRDLVELNGGEYFVVRSVRDVMEAGL